MSTKTSSIAIDVAELCQMLEEGKPLAVLDVRPAEDRREWAIPGSIHVDAYQALNDGDPDALADIGLPDDQPIVTVCAAGRTSLLAALHLRKLGLNAWSLSGGMEAWTAAWNVAEVRMPSSTAIVLQVRRTGKGCLSYVIGSGDQALVIDVSLDPDVYIEIAREHGWRIAAVVDTHIHADHLSRSRLLAEQTGAALYLPEQDRVGYPFEPLRDGDVLEFGDARLTAIHTPGHTLESMSYLLNDHALFTGDTLFLEGVGRPDLEASPEQARERAHLLYGSLRRLASLPDNTVILPGHTSSPVAFDGEPLQGSLAAVREHVHILGEDEATFVAWILGRIPSTPPNHHLIVELNEAGLLPGVANQAGLEAGANRCAVS